MKYLAPCYSNLSCAEWVTLNVPEPRKQDEVRDVVILGIEEQSIELARQLKKNNWRVMMTDVDEAACSRVFPEMD